MARFKAVPRPDDLAWDLTEKRGEDTVVIGVFQENGVAATVAALLNKFMRLNEDGSWSIEPLDWQDMWEAGAKPKEPTDG
jgi:hypothetical protein